MNAEEVLDNGAEAYTREAEESGRQFGIEDAGGVEADLTKAGEVLACRMQDPLLVSYRRCEFLEGADRGRIEKEYPGPPAIELNEIGPLGKGESGSPLGIDGDGPFALGDELDG